MPYVVVRFAGYGVQTAAVAKSEEAARAMLQVHESTIPNEASRAESGLAWPSGASGTQRSLLSDGREPQQFIVVRKQQ